MSSKSKTVTYKVECEGYCDWLSGVGNLFLTAKEARDRIKRRHASDILFGRTKTVARIVRITEEVVD